MINLNIDIIAVHFFGLNAFLFNYMVTGVQNLIRKTYIDVK